MARVPEAHEPPPADETRAAADPGAQWDAVIAAYRHWAKDRRDADRQRALEAVARDTGFDAALTETLLQVCRGGAPPFDVTRALGGLKRRERLHLIASCLELCAPIRMLPYPARAPVPEGSELADLGISVRAVQRIGANNPPSGTCMPYHEVLLREKRVTIDSPLSGRPLTSSASLLNLAGTGRPSIAFHFVDDGEPFFLFTNTFSGCFSGLFFPARALMLSLPAETPRTLAGFRALVIEFAAETVAHLTYQEDRQTALLAGTMNHFGHSILNEYEAYHQCAEAGLFHGVDVVLRGWANFVAHDELFPELAHVPVVELADQVAGYRAIVDGRYIVARPTCNYWFSDGLGTRLREVARRRIATAPSADLIRARRCRPLLWVEIRSHDRRWADQEQQLPQLIDRLAERFEHLGVVLAGWSRMIDAHPHDEKMVASDAALVAAIVRGVTSEAATFDITGVTTLEKMTWAQTADVFLCTYGTGIIFPSCVAAIPGVMHTNSAYVSGFLKRPPDRLISWIEQPTRIRLIGPEHTVDEDPEQPHGVRNHSLGWRPVFDELLPLMSAVEPRDVQPE